MSSPLVTPTELTDYQNGDPELAIAIATGQIRDYCGWHITPSVTETVTVDGPCSHVLTLPTLYLTAVSSVVEEGVTVSADEFDWSDSGYLRRRRCTWTGKPRGIIVGITHGYEEVPPAVKAAALALASLTQTPASAATSQSAGPYSIQLATRSDGSAGGAYMPEDVADMLAPYRIFGVA